MDENSLKINTELEQVLAQIEAYLSREETQKDNQKISNYLKCKIQLLFKYKMR